MSGNPFTNKNVMEDYMSALLTDEPILENVQRQSVEQLFKNEPITRTEPFIEPTAEPVENAPVMTKFLEPDVEKSLVAIETPSKVIKPIIPENNV